MWSSSLEIVHGSLLLSAELDGSRLTATCVDKPRTWLVAVGTVAMKPSWLLATSVNVELRQTMTGCLRVVSDYSESATGGLGPQ
jgi:hypothetical protein